MNNVIIGMLLMFIIFTLSSQTMNKETVIDCMKTKRIEIVDDDGNKKIELVGKNKGGFPAIKMFGNKSNCRLELLVDDKGPSIKLFNSIWQKAVTIAGYDNNTFIQLLASDPKYKGFPPRTNNGLSVLLRVSPDEATCLHLREKLPAK